MTFTTPGGRTLNVHLNIMFTMNDAKVMNAIYNVHDSNCYICVCGYGSMNDYSNVRNGTFEARQDRLVHGIGGLHCMINVFRHLLKLSYKIAERDAEDIGRDGESAKARRKKQIQAAFTPLGIIIDKPSPQARGNTTDGNCVRKAFRDPVFLARTLHLDVELVRRLW